MKNRNGFTLIELLAVIVILAIIALIATPIILNVIDTARKGAKESSALGYIDAIEKHVMLAEVDSSSTKLTAGTYSVSQLKAAHVDVKGETPDDSGIVVINTKGAIEQAWFTFEEGKYKVYYDGSKAVASTGNDYLDSSNTPHNDIPEAGSSNEGSNTPSVKTYSAGEAVYLDPTNLSTTCNAENSVSTPGTKSGCMKFYVIKDNGSSIDVLLDHNTTATVAYETSGTYKEYAQASIKTQVDSDTTGWTNGLNPRLITANEIATITNTTTFNGSSSTWFYFNGSGDKKQTKVSSTAGDNEYAWLFDYTKNCTNNGCNTADSSTFGYWTSSLVSDYSNFACNVDCSGSSYFYSVGNDGSYGIRPVITVSKSIFN